MTAQDPELSAALGWPGGISDPVLDRKVLLQMVAALRLASQQALEALYQAREFTELYDTEHAAAVNERCHENITALRAALAESERDWSLLEATQASLREHMAEIRRLRAALAQQDEPVQEPVAPQRTMVPLTEEEIYHATGHCGVSEYMAINIARVIEEVSWEKNHG